MKRAHRLNPLQMAGSRATVTGRDGVSAVRQRQYGCAPSAAADGSGATDLGVTNDKTQSNASAFGRIATKALLGGAF
jgi:hypothetical protein